MNRKYKRDKMQSKIIEPCKSPKSARELSDYLDINLNTLCSKYLYPLYNKNKLSRNLRKYTSTTLKLPLRDS